MKGFIINCLLIIFLIPSNFAQTEKISSLIDIKTFEYAVKDTSHLALDVYTLKQTVVTQKKPCILFVFGGAFIGGHRNNSIYNKYFNYLAENNYVVVSPSYRLGLKGVQHVSKFNVKPLKNAVNIAVEDIYDATNFIIAHADELGIDTSKIILSGSSAGAITVLEADYWKRNEKPAAKKLPAGFQYAGIISFSGAILDFNWSLKYNTPAAPMMLFHGSGDKIVPFKKIKFFNIGFYGSSYIAKTLKKNKSPFYFYDYADLGHEVSVIPMYENLQDINEFIDTFIINKKPYQINYIFKNLEAKPELTMSAKELLEKLNKN